jgi:hypothetical protein
VSDLVGKIRHAHTSTGESHIDREVVLGECLVEVFEYFFGLGEEVVGEFRIEPPDVLILDGERTLLAGPALSERAAFARIVLGQR